MHYSTNPEEIKTKIERLGQNRTKLPLSMLFVELKPAPNNKDIYNVEYLQQCKTKFEPLKYKKGHRTTCKLSKIPPH
jgi:hypothetical protein